MKTVTLISLAILFGTVSQPMWAREAVTTDKTKAPSAAAQSVQPEVSKQTQDTGAEKRKALLADATEAIAQTKNALKLLEEKKSDEAIKALAAVTGRLELILARDPKLALAPVDTEIVTHDLHADADTVKEAISLAQKFLDNGEVQKARRLIANLGSEIDYNTVNIPLAT